MLDFNKLFCFKGVGIMVSFNSLDKDSINLIKEQTLKLNLREDTLRLHGLLQQLPKYKKEDIRKIPFNDGICFFFEEGESYNNLNRIVRVGTHIADGKLKQRLRDHYKPNQEGSVFRKSIGKSIIRYDQFKFEELLDLELSSGNLPRKIKKYEKEKNIEKRITDYLDKSFTYVCIKVEDKELRLRLEEGIVALLCKSEDFKPSGQWFGRYSPNEEIRNSGLWLREGITDNSLTKDEIQDLEYLIWDTLLEYKDKHK